MHALITTSMQRRPDIEALAVRTDDNNDLPLKFHGKSLYEDKESARAGAFLMTTIVWPTSVAALTGKVLSK